MDSSLDDKKIYPEVRKGSLPATALNESGVRKICNSQPTRCVAMPSVMAARWVGPKYSGPTFRRLWIKVHRIKFAYVLQWSVRSLQRPLPIDDVLYS